MSLFNSQEIEVLSTVIIALESGGAVYGNGDWSAFAEAYANSGRICRQKSRLMRY